MKIQVQISWVGQSNVLLGINNREMKSESDFSLAMASQPLCATPEETLIWIAERGGEP